jgi:LPXTG-motif cell wall-anchored protein
VSVNRASIRLTAVAAVASMLLGPVAASAAAWDNPDCDDRDHGDHHSWRPDESSPPHHSWPKPAPTPAPVAPKPAPAPIPAAPVAPPAPAPAPAPAPVPAPVKAPTAPKPAAPTTPATPAPPATPPVSPPVSLGVPDVPVSETVTPEAPPEKGGVLGKVGTREENVKGKTGKRNEGVKPAVLYETADTTATQNTAQLAETGFNVQILAILGVLALAGSGLLFWRTRAS